MTDLKTLIQNEYSDLSLNIEAGQIVSAYNKERRKTAAFSASTAVCVLIILTVFVQTNPWTVEGFMKSTGNFFSSFFRGTTSSESYTQLSPSDDNSAVGIADKQDESTDETKSSEITTDKAENDASASLTETESYDPDYDTDALKTETDAAEITESDETVQQTATDSEQEPKHSDADSATVAEKPVAKKLETAKIEYVQISGNSVKITKCIPNGKKVVIPEMVDDFTVRSIRSGFLEGYPLVTKVELPDTVTDIDENAFKDMKNLVSVKMPAKIKSIGNSAFEGCTALKAVDLYKVEEIGKYAFKNCKSLESITIPKTAEIVGTEAFAYCEGLKTADVSSDCDDNDSFVRGYTFRGCKKLETLSFGSSVTKVFDWQFYQCYALKNIIFNSSLEYIGNSAFSCCSSLERLDLSNGITSIRSKAFYKCSSLHEVVLPEAIESVREKAFFNCKKLTSITLPRNLSAIESKCFGFTDDGKVSGFTVIGYENTRARTYAVNSGLQFVSLGRIPDPTTVILDSHIAVLNVGDNYEIKYKVEYPDGKTVFKSSDDSVATVDGEGIITAQSQGKATITVTNNGACAQFIVIVK